MAKLIYNIYESHIHLIINGEILFLPKEDPRFNKVLAALHEDRLDDAEALINPSKVIKEELSLRIENGIIFYKNEELPQVLSDKIYEKKLSGENVESLLRLWTSLKFNEDFKKKKKQILELLDQIVPFEHVCLIPDGKVFNIKNFYNISSKNVFFKKVIEGKSLQEILADEGITGDKLVKLVKKELFSSSLNFNIIYFLKAFKSININNIMVLHDLKIHQLISSDKMAENCKIFFNLNNFSEKKIMSIFTEKFHSDYFIDTIRYFDKIKQVQNLSFSDCSSWQTWNEEVLKYLAQIDKKVIVFNWLQKRPELAKIDFKINEDFHIKLPQTSIELQAWGNQMGNCIGSYKDSALNSKTMLLLGIYKNDKLLYNLEIKGKKLIQFERRNKTSVDPVEKKLIVAYLKKHKILA